MEKKILSIGIVIFVVGLFLVVAYWPLTAVKGRDISTDDYEVGDKVTIYGTITRITGLGEMYFIQIDGELEIVKLDGQTSMEEGDMIYGKIRCTQDIIRYWRLEEDLKLKRNIDLLFYGITGVGVAVTTVGVVKI